MIRYSKILFILTITVLLLWLLPWFYHFVTEKPAHTPFTLYSNVANNFVYIDYSEDKEITYRDRNGHAYTDSQFDSLLPLFYYRQLLSDGRLPDSLNGESLTPQKINLTNFIFRLSASDVNKKTPALYPLLEAMSGRVDLKMPDDVFRLTDRIEFIDMETNTVNEAKSKLFTKAMLDKGFRFPVTCIGGNPTEKKDYDNGYFLTDSAHRLFHLKQLRGRPFFRPVALPEGMEIRHITVREYPHRKFHAFLTDSRNRFWVLAAPGYELHRLPVETYDPRTHDMQIVGNLFDWTVSIAKADGEHIYAVDAGDYSLVDTLTYPATESLPAQIGRFLFPCEIGFTSCDDQYVRPRLNRFSPQALWLPALIALFLYRRHCRKKRK